jgi:hypothetical protein
MFGNVFRCTNCPFEFCSGWSHHASGQFLVCKACGRHFVLSGGQSCWGAISGELLQLSAATEEGDSPTGVIVKVSVPKLDAAEEWNGVSVLQFDDVPCPNCGGTDVLVQSLDDESPCPACRTGLVKEEGTCIY